MGSAQARAADPGRARRRFLARLNVRWRCTGLGAVAAAHGTVSNALTLCRCVLATRARCALTSSPAGRMVARDVVDGGTGAQCNTLFAPYNNAFGTCCDPTAICQVVRQATARQPQFARAKPQPSDSPREPLVVNATRPRAYIRRHVADGRT